MYITTFYSFKGGVGRTFALVNVATALARAGRKVLIVDFDLEAPGLQTFDELKPNKACKGVVEFVSDYIAIGSTADVRDYVYETEGVAANGGRLWVMPAGSGDCNYRKQLSNIHWQSLYAEQDGYLMIEDLKAQWEDSFNPDYVLIDSRTGHTDVEGICTRQLPDAVVLLFFPNEQNLAGLKEVVEDIKRDRSRIDRLPKLHFVVSNVPELDDEDDVLKGSMHRFRKSLGFTSHNSIRHYPSLALVDQCIFVLNRPKSRLTREYLKLKDSIIEHNMRDREAAVDYLRRGVRPYGFRFESAKQEVELRLEEIRKHHPNDGEILFLIAMLRRSEGRTDEALQLLDKAIENDFKQGKVFLERASGRLYTGAKSNAAEDALHALSLTDLSDTEVAKAARLLGVAEENRLDAVWESVALQKTPVSQRGPIVEALMRFREGLPSAIKILENELETTNQASSAKSAAHNLLTLCLIGNRRFEDAMRRPDAKIESSVEVDISDRFNFAMCTWAKSNAQPGELLTDLAEEFERNEENAPTGANYPQCWALVLAAIGRSDEAINQAEEAKRRIEKSGEMAFSCWRYLNALPKDFSEDCNSIIEFAKSGIPSPIFISS
ncbi:MAG: AAA family ATPase [Pirellulaceae bacterium]|nr:AAA family ATPase [Pirellulaceae bacterium]